MNIRSDQCVRISHGSKILNQNTTTKEVNSEQAHILFNVKHFPHFLKHTQKLDLSVEYLTAVYGLLPYFTVLDDLERYAVLPSGEDKS